MLFNRFFLCTLLLPLSQLVAVSQELNPVDIMGPDGFLYPNWSRAGVEGGIPDVPVKAHLSDFGGLPDDHQDDVDALEQGMKAVGAMGGGALLLEAGRYELHRPVVCFQDGVVVRGQGADRTKIIFDYLPKNGVVFFQPAPNSMIHSDTWIEIHARPDQLRSLAIKVNGKQIASREYNPHWGGTFDLRTTGANVLREIKSGEAVLQAVAEYEGGVVAEATIPITLSSESNREPRPSALPKYIGALTFTGQNPFGPRYRLSADAERGDTELQMEQTGDLHIGDIIVIEAPKTERWDRLVQNACLWGTYRRNEYRIAGIQGNTITLNEPLRIPYPIIDESYVQRYRPIVRCGVENLSIEQTQQLWTSGVMFSYAWNCWARGVNVHKAGRWPVYTTPAKHCEIRDCYFEDAWYHGGGGTAYVGFETAYDCLMDNVTTLKMRHAPCVQWSSAGNVIRNSTFTQSDGQWHAGWTHENLFENCVIDAQQGTGAYGNGFWASPPNDQAHGPNGPRNVVWGCDVKAPKAGVWMGGMNEGWLILYNQFHCDEGPAVFMKTNSDNHAISRNLFILNNPKSSAFVIQTEDCNGVRITDNTVVGGKKELFAGKGTPEENTDNQWFSSVDQSGFTKPERPVPSIFEWQREKVGK